MLKDILAAFGVLALVLAATVIVGCVKLYRTLRSPGTFGFLAVMGPDPEPLTTTETIVCGAILGVLAGFVHSFGLGAPWPALLQFAIAVTAVYGVNVITGEAFRNLFNLPPGVLMLISLVLGGLQIGIPYIGIGSSFWTSVIQGVIALFLSLGFGTAITTAVVKRARAR